MAEVISSPSHGPMAPAETALQPGFIVPPSARSGKGGWHSYAIPIGLFLLVFMVFMPALDASLVNWDDDRLLNSHTHHHSLSVENLVWMFTTSDFGHFQPLTWLSFALDYALWWEDPFGYHLTSVALHAASVVVFYFIAVRLLTACKTHDPSTGLESRIRWAGGVAAVFFGCHPLRAESVAWLAERRDVLSGLFCLLSVLCYLRHTGHDSNLTTVENVERPRSRANFMFSVVFFALTLLAKASAMTLALVLMLLDVYPLRRLQWNKRLFDSPQARSALMEKVPFLLLGTLAAGRALFAQHQAGALSSLVEADAWSRLSNASFGLAFYLWKTALPMGLGPLIQLPSESQSVALRWIVSLGVLVVVLCLLVRYRNRAPGAIIAALCYVVLVAPVLGLFQAGPQVVADRYSYLPCLGFAVVVGWIFLRLREGLGVRMKEGSAAITALASVTLCAVLAHATFDQTGYWRDPLTLWARGVAVSPNSSIAHVNFADALAKSVQYALARKHYDRALELDPKDAIAWHHRGDLSFLLEHEDDAIADYLSALSIDPNRRAHFPLARLLVYKGRPVEAVAVLRDGLQRYPTSWDMMDYLASLLSTYPDERFRNGQEAVGWAEKLNQHHEGKHAPTLLTLASAMAEAGRFTEAVQTGQAGLRLAQVQGDDRLLAEFERRLSLFAEGRAYSLGMSTSNGAGNDYLKFQQTAGD